MSRYVNAKTEGRWDCTPLTINKELSTGQKIRQDKQDEQDYFAFHHGKS